MKRLNRFDVEWRSLSLLRRRLAGCGSPPQTLTRHSSTANGEDTPLHATLRKLDEEKLSDCLLSGKPLDAKYRAALSGVLAKMSVSEESVRRHEEVRQKAAAAVVLEAVAMDDRNAAQEKVMNHFYTWKTEWDNGGAFELSLQLPGILDDLRQSFGQTGTNSDRAHKEALIIEKLTPLVGRWHSDFGESLLLRCAPVPSAVEVWLDKHCRGLPSILYDTFRGQLVILHGASDYSGTSVEPFNKGFEPPVGGKLFKASIDVLYKISVCCRGHNTISDQKQCGRVAVITGPAGSGKTITALMAARAASPLEAGNNVPNHKALIFFALAKTLFGRSNADATLQNAPTIDAVADLVVRRVAKGLGLYVGARLRQTDACLTLVIDEMDGYSQMLRLVAAARLDIATRLKALLGVQNVQIFCTMKEVIDASTSAVASESDSPGEHPDSSFDLIPMEPFLWPHLVKTMQHRPYKTFITRNALDIIDDDYFIQNTASIREGIKNARYAARFAQKLFTIDYDRSYRYIESEDMAVDIQSLIKN